QGRGGQSSTDITKTRKCFSRERRDMEPHWSLLLALVLGAAAVDVSGSNEVENVQNSVLQRRLSRDRRNASDYQTYIGGGDMQWIDSYTTLVLTCTVSRPELAEAPEYISWYHNSVVGQTLSRILTIKYIISITIAIIDIEVCIHWQLHLCPI
ncbi:unnamed protein product, partial [Meganyctiphanes norvegica]